MTEIAEQVRSEVRAEPVPWLLKLYVAGQTPNAIAALENLKRICEGHLKGQYSIEIIDLRKNPELAKEAQIVAIPALVRHLPPPMKKIIGDLALEDRVLFGLDLRGAQPDGKRN